MNGLLSLKWNNHSSALLKKLSNLLIKDSYADATLVCNGRYFPVHRLVLSTCSEYFEEIFEKIQCKHPFIIIKDMDPIQLEALLNYMYKGEVNVLQELLPGLIKAAEALKIKGLAVSDDHLDSDKYKREKRENQTSSPVPQKKVKKIEERKLSQHDDSLNSNNEKSFSNSISSNASPSNKEDNEKLVSVKLEPLEPSTNTKEYHEISIKSSVARESKTGLETHSQTPPIISEMSQNEESSLSSDVFSENAQCSSWKSGAANEENSQSSILDEEEVSLFTTNQSPVKKLENHIYLTSEECEELTSSRDDVDNNEYIIDVDPFIDNRSFADDNKVTKCNWQYCTFILSNQTDLERHVNNFHSLDQPFSCCYCLYRTTNPDGLKSHLTEQHPGVKMFFCFLCNYTSEHVGNVVKHIRIHTGTKPYNCSYCDYRTTQSSNLTRHIRSRHHM